MMTAEEMVAIVRSMSKHPTNRKGVGDLFIHVLRQERPDIAEFIEGTLYDPSGKSTIHPKVVDVVKTRW